MNDKLTRQGLVVEIGGTIGVLDDLGTLYQAWLKKSHQTVHKDKSNSLALGDHVEFELQDKLAVIHRILPPRTLLLRQSTHQSRKSQVIASNLDQAMVIVAKNYPETPIGMIDRMLIACQSGGIDPLLVINKEDEIEDLHPEIEQIYPALGIPVHRVSAKTMLGIDLLKQRLQGKKTIFLGVSGVGKTSLVKVLTGIDLRVNQLNIIGKSGKHTTTHSKLYQLAPDTFIADIPGIKQLGFVNLEAVASFYPEISQASQRCKFSSCSHIHEPSCAVKEALEKGDIHPKRFASYLKLIKEQIPHWE